MRASRVRATIVTTLAALAAALVAFRPGGDAPAPMSDSSPRKPRTDLSALVARMTLDEKLALMSGLVVDERGRVELLGVERLGVPPVLVTDGPAGVTARGVPGGATSLPAPLALAATFSPSLALAYGDVLGREAAAAGAGMLFGPELNLIRDPRDGRAFEKLGEDPVLAAALGAPLVRGIQRHRVIATPKHFVANDQERWRMRVRQQVGARALRELYLPPFEAALRAGAGALMAAYPVVNGTHMTANAALLRIPRQSWKWPGVIVSDYFATHATGPALRAGLDVELPLPIHFGEPLRQAVIDGRVPQANVDRAAARVVAAMTRAGLVGRAGEHPDRSPHGTATARQVAEAGTVLLENRHHTLPLPQDLRSVAVIGPGALDPATGLGSAHVAATRAIGVADGLRRALPRARVTVTGAWTPADLPSVPAEALRDVTGRYHDDPALRGPAIARRERHGFPIDLERRARNLLLTDGRWSAHWRGTLVPPETGGYELGTLAAGAVRLRLGGRLLLDGGAPGDVDMHPPRPESVRVRLRAGRPLRLDVDYVASSTESPSLRVWWLRPSELAARRREAVAAARTAGAAVVAVRDWSGEGGDRPTLRLPAGQEELIRAVARANPHTVVVLQSGGPVDVSPWAHVAPALLESWYPGEQGGPALAAVLLGRVDATGRLPVTFPRRLADTPTARRGRYPRTRPRMRYGEGRLIGFRWYDAQGISPRYPFGFGRSYADFSFRDLSIRGRRVTFSIVNTGDRPGTAVPQVYLRLPEHSAPLRLATFARVPVEAGRQVRVRLVVPERSVQVWRRDRWIRPRGHVDVTVRTDARTVQLGPRSLR